MGTPCRTPSAARQRAGRWPRRGERGDTAPVPLLSRPLLLCVGLVLPGLALASSGAGLEASGHGVIRNIAICMVAASAMGLLSRLLRQPLLLGYLLGGVAIGPLGLRLIADQAQISTVAEIGLILLLFMIGLEIDLKKMLAAGRLVIVTGLVQFPLSVAAGYGLFALLAHLGLYRAEGRHAVLYAALAISISSTMIVVKLLYDKLELDTLPGRITVGILVFQDIWAIITLALQPNLSNPQVAGLVQTFGAGALLVVATLLTSRYVLPHVFHQVAKVPELLLVLSLGWCFLVGLVAAHPRVGLSMEMGALIAGVALATFPYNLDVIAKVLSIRDFFITLFFVALGMQIPFPELGVLQLAALTAVGLLLTRLLGVFGVLYALRAGHRTALLPALNLSQMSEFSLVILSIGLAHGHIAQDTLTVGIWTFALLAVGSTYAIQGSHALQGGASRLLAALGLRDLPASPGDADGARSHERPVVLLGYFRIASAFLEEVARRDQHLLEELKVVDFNPEARTRLAELGVPCLYGDVSHLDTLHHAGIHHARVVLCTLTDTVLRGTTNLKLLRALRDLCPGARLILTAETPEQARELYAGGADYVLQPAGLAGASLVSVVEQALRGSCEGMREEAQWALGLSPGR